VVAHRISDLLRHRQGGARAAARHGRPLAAPGHCRSGLPAGPVPYGSPSAPDAWELPAVEPRTAGPTADPRRPVRGRLPSEPGRHGVRPSATATVSTVVRPRPGAQPE
jgi:hypothetical protein